jgi:hypothetical protein
LCESLGNLKGGAKGKLTEWVANDFNGR